MLSRGSWIAWVISWGALLGGVALSGEQGPVLTKAIEVRSLSLAEAEMGLDVRLRGTVTFIEPPSAVFLQDETAGSFFRPERLDELRPGDVIEVTGQTQRGTYLPGMGVGVYRLLSRGPLPEAIPVNYDDLVSGRVHYQRVAIEGIVRSWRRIETSRGLRSLVRVAMASRIVEVRLDEILDPTCVLVDGRVRVEGLAVGLINRRRQLVQPYLRASHLSAIQILQEAPPESAVPQISASELLTFRVTGQGDHRVRMAGVVTACLAKDVVFVRDAATAFGVSFSEPVSVAVGDHITMLGFPEMDRFSAALVDATLVGRSPGAAPQPIDIDVEQIWQGLHDGELVAMEGMVTDFFRTDEGMVLALQVGERAIQARTPVAEVDVAPGTRVRVVGICQVEASQGVVYTPYPVSVSLRLRSADDITVLDAPPWWTVRRLLAVLAVLGTFSLLAGLWISALRRQVARQTDALRLRIESEAVLQERQRMAREFHDTLEQELAGLSLRLDAVATRPIDPKAHRLLAASRNLVARIQAETRNLICDLRSSSETAGDLVAALHELTERTTEHVGVEVRLRIKESPPRLSTTQVHHLRMIVAECITNALKHAEASVIEVGVDFRNGRIELEVTDDGRGFEVTTEALYKRGHFGCMGMRERSRKLGAEVTWSSTPGAGTTVEISLPLAGIPAPLLSS